MLCSFRWRIKILVPLDISFCHSRRAFLIEVALLVIYGKQICDENTKISLDASSILLIYDESELRRRPRVHCYYTTARTTSS